MCPPSTRILPSASAVWPAQKKRKSTAVSVTSVKVSAAGSHTCAALLTRSHARIFPVGRSTMCTATIGHVKGPVHAPTSCAWVDATITFSVEIPPRVAVRVTVWAVVTVPAVAVKVAEVELAGTVTEPGADSAPELFEDSATLLPLVGAGWVKVTVHVVVAAEITCVGLQASDDTLGPPPPPDPAGLKAAICAR